MPGSSNRAHESGCNDCRGDYYDNNRQHREIKDDNRTVCLSIRYLSGIHFHRYGMGVIDAVNPDYHSRNDED